MGRVTPKADVFSFGVIIMELLTGKRPTSTSLLSDSGEGISLQEWVKNGMEDGGDGISEVIDGQLVESMDNNGEELRMVNLLKVSVMCTNGAADDRPTMSQVLTWLVTIKENGGQGRL